MCALRVRAPVLPARCGESYRECAPPRVDQGLRSSGAHQGDRHREATRATRNGAPFQGGSGRVPGGREPLPRSCGRRQGLRPRALRLRCRVLRQTTGSPAVNSGRLQVTAFAAQGKGEEFGDPLLAVDRIMGGAGSKQRGLAREREWGRAVRARPSRRRSGHRCGDRVVRKGEERVTACSSSAGDSASAA
jgi:hypothetical protein